MVIAWIFVIGLIFVGSNVKASAVYAKNLDGNVYLVILLSFLSSVAAINFDQGFEFHHDERFKTQEVKNYISGQGASNLFHPDLLIILAFVLIKLLNISELSYVLIGRFISCFAFCVSTWFVWRLAKILNFQYPYLAALIFCLNPAIYPQSFYFKEDMLLLMVGLGFITSCLNSRQIGWWQGILFGLVLSAKHSGFLLAGILIFLNKRLTLSFFLCAAVTYVLVHPKILVDPSLLASGLKYEWQHALRGEVVPASIWQFWGLFYIFRTFVPGFLYVLAPLVFMSLGFIWSKRDKPISSVVLVCVLWWFVKEMLPLKIEPNPERYVLIPCALLSIFFAEFVGWLFKNSAVFVCVVFGVFRVWHLFDILTDSRFELVKQLTKISESKILVDAILDHSYLKEGFVYETLGRPGYLAYAQALKSEKLKNYDYIILTEFRFRYFIYWQLKASTNYKNEVFRGACESKRKLKQLVKSYGIYYESTKAFLPFGFHNPKTFIIKLASPADKEKVDWGYNIFWPLKVGGCS